MQLNRHPIYRRSIYPWYDSELACVITILFVSILLVFGIVGISTAREKYEYQPYVWVPFLITGLSLIVIVSSTIRLARKLFRRFSETVSRIDSDDSP